jgi:putative transposase
MIIFCQIFARRPRRGRRGSIGIDLFFLGTRRPRRVLIAKFHLDHRSQPMPEHRRLPHLQPFAAQPVIFLTVVTFGRRACLADPTVFDTLTAIWQRSPTRDGWYVGDYLLMPDHVHLFTCSALEAKPLARWLETWKSLSARQLKTSIGIKPPLWQRDYFDRFLRSEDNYSDKWHYVALNPVRKRLCDRPEDWPWKGRLHDLSF